MRYLLHNCLMLLILFIISTINAQRKVQSLCADKSLYCKRRGHLCENYAFHNVMQSVCKKTCNLCEHNQKDEIIEQDENETESNLEADVEEEDEGADNTDYSETETNIHQTGEEEVTDEAPTTLSTTITYSTKETEKQVICTDLSRDCEGKRYLCSQQTYAYLMSKQCPKTCGKCQPNHRPDEECRDTTSNCNESLCNRQSYQQLMRKFCKKTCSFC